MEVRGITARVRESGKFVWHMNIDPFADPFKSGLVSSADIFAKQRGGGGRRAPAKPSEAPEEERLEEAPAEEAVEEEKDKVVLKNPKWEVEKVGFNEETEVSVEAVIPKAHAHLTKVAFELFAKTPNGPESISKAEGQVEGGKAKGRVPVYIPQYKDEDGNLMAKVEYYFSAKHSMSELLMDDSVLKLVDEMADRVLESLVLEHVTFATDKSLVRPNQGASLKAMCDKIKAWRDKHPDGKMAVFGHADTVGADTYNKTLSDRRAKAVHGYLVKDPKVWESLYNDEKWGLASTQELLKHLGHDPGAIDGKFGPETEAAIKGFQKKQGMAESGKDDATTREALYKAFMDEGNALDLKAKDFDAIDGSPFVGCSEFNLAEKKEGACEANRRVAVFLLKSNKNFPIQYPCKKGSVDPCRKQAARKGDRRTAGFSCLFYDQLVKEEKGGGGEPAKLGPIKFAGIKEAEIKQYVNLPVGTVGQGMERLIEVEVEGAPDGTDVFWKVTAGEKNSKRNDPKTGAKVTDKDALVEFKDRIAEASSKTKGTKASLVICCGAAGGDTFSVEAGPAKDKLEVKVLITNWRKLVYEILAPDFMPFEERAMPNGTKVMDFSAGMRDRIKDRLGKGFVEYEVFKSHTFTEAEAPECSVFKSEQLGLSAGKKAYVLTDHTFRSYPKTFDKGMLPRSIGLKLCNRNFFFESRKTKPLRHRYTLNSDSFKVKVTTWYGVYFLPKSAENGLDSVKSFTWKALVNPLTHPDHPGVRGGAARTGVLNSNLIELITTSEFGFKLPSASPDDPGLLAGPAVSDEKCPIEVTIEFEGASAGLGLAGQGAQQGENLVVFNADSPDSFVDVLLHELGHSMGQTVYAGYYDPPKGMVTPKTSAEKDPTYAHNGTNGHTYVEKLHSGSHCSYGLSDAEKTLASYEGQPGTCIMFGENSGKDPSSATTGFCPLCVDYIKGRNLLDLGVLN